MESMVLTTSEKTSSWRELLELVFPPQFKNKNVIDSLCTPIQYYEEKRNSLLLNSFSKFFDTIPQEKLEELSNFLITKSPDTLVDTVLNTCPNIMLALMSCLNWELVRKRCFYIFIRDKTSEVQFGDGATLLRIHEGVDNLPKVQEVLAPFISLLVNVNVVNLYFRCFDDIQIKQNFQSLCTTENFTPPPFFKRMTSDFGDIFPETEETHWFFQSSRHNDVRAKQYRWSRRCPFCFTSMQGKYFRRIITERIMAMNGNSNSNEPST
ncbi:unnamed protein product [Caenorhabditis sp. 36 PRJEB53466]|nr:unnamed protein product [Caenorhabditis sp. 36 PRJEB53466]